MIVTHNRTAAKEDVLTMDEVIQNCVVFHLAGVETSRNAVEFTLQHLARDHSTQEKIRTNIIANLDRSKLNLMETYEKNLPLQHLTREILRLYGPAVGLVDRHATKDFKLGAYKIKQGTVLNIFYNYFHHNDQNYPNPLQFDWERYSDEKQLKVKQAVYMPFSLGKRNCIGRYLGEIMVQIALI